MKNVIRQLHLRREPSLLPDERVVAFKDSIQAVLAKSLPTWQFSATVLGLQHLSMQITTHRVLFVSRVFVALQGELNLWYSRDGREPEEDVLMDASVGRSWLNVPYLELRSRREARAVLRSRDLMIRIYANDAQTLHDALLAALPS